MSEQWQKSSFSGAGGENCLEVTGAESHFFLRESEAPGNVIELVPTGLLGLIRHLKAEV
ncbi:DUF397 domain-containing protein [Streptomyces sp. NPDC088812]|uniref:DUF397 domain-containing protein n=1 Tax=Streptomyces sp. NPDC088812 TaxID=3365905 RepID=UPI00380825D6